MMRSTSIITRLAALIALAAVVAMPALAENSTKVGGYVIHHNAFTADTLNPDVAKSYGIQRSKYRGLLNVSVIKEEQGTTGTSTAARVEVNTVNLTGQKSRIPMRELKDQGAIYYVGEFPVHDQQTINFLIDVTPEGSPETFSTKLSQQFFTE